MAYKDLNNTGQDVTGINRIFNEVSDLNGIKNDAALSYFLHIAPPVISKMRNGKLPMGDSMILRLHEIGGMDVAHIRAELAVKKATGQCLKGEE